MIHSVLVVCSGNICRSPYAECRLRSLMPELEVNSAGLCVSESQLDHARANRTAIQVAAESGIDLRHHRAKQLTEALVDDYDVILVMERQQLETLCDEFPFASYKAFLFGRWTGGMNIDDPYKQSPLKFRLAFSHIDDAAEAWVRKL